MDIDHTDCTKKWFVENSIKIKHKMFFNIAETSLKEYTIDVTLEGEKHLSLK